MMQIFHLVLKSISLFFFYDFSFGKQSYPVNAFNERSTGIVIKLVPI